MATQVVANPLQELLERVRRLRESGDIGVMAVEELVEAIVKKHYHDSVHETTTEKREQARSSALALEGLLKNIRTASMAAVKSIRGNA